jgi:hypothetical protein
MVMIDGFTGPQIAPMNLAGVLPWIHWRGVLILTLFIAGNFFCMACPFTLPRSLARRWLPSGRAWPRVLRSKWVATGLVAIFLWSYEAFSLWDNPWITAWIIVGYFIAAFFVDSFFKEAAFCKYVCPIGQFNFVQSLVSPLEVRVRQPDVCTTCISKECIRGTPNLPGCELQLFQPRKQGNLDCTFCLDCVHACPHQNVGILFTTPGSSLRGDPVRSGVGRFSRRPDLAALVLILVFGAFANAAGMIGPVVRAQEALRQSLGNLPRPVIVSASYALAIVLLPLVCIATAASVSRLWGKLQESTLMTATRFTFAFVPLGFGMWLSHYSFHFFTSWQTLLPTTQRFAGDLGWHWPGEPLWECACCQGAPAWILNVELLMLDVGLIAALYTGFCIAESIASSILLAVKAMMPWATLMILLFLLGVWILIEPMEMRGTLPTLGLSQFVEQNV